MAEEPRKQGQEEKQPIRKKGGRRAPDTSFEHRDLSEDAQLFGGGDLGPKPDQNPKPKKND